MNKDRTLLRELAFKYAELANSDDNQNKIKHHCDVNDLKSKKPILLIDEIPWHEMNFDDQLTLRCEGDFERGIEWFFREKLFRAKYIPCDTVYQPYFPLNKQIQCSGVGMDQIYNEHDESAQSFTYVDQLKNEEDIDKLGFQEITYNNEATMEAYCKTADIFGDVLPVKLVGAQTGYGFGLKTMDDIVRMRGLDTFFFDFIERPEYMHKLIGKLTDIFVDTMRQLEDKELLDNDSYYCHSTSALSNDLPKAEGKVRLKNLWGRGLAQIFASVSPAMHEEFDINYMIKALEPFGLVYYGCCEPLDKKIDIVSKIPNLRKISITPWADVANACEQIKGKYVVSSKPNPSSLATDNIDEDVVTEEIMKISKIVKENNCSCELVLKDITTVNGNPENLIKWHDAAMRVINSVF